jgi:hypothetical protein
MSKGFFRRPLLRAGFTVIAGLLAVLAVSCHVIKRTDTYSIERGNCAIYGHIFQKPTQQILQLHDVVCRRNVNCTADWLSKNVNWSGWGAAEWQGALRDDRGTLKSSLDRIRAGKEKCLVLKKDVCGWNAGNTNFQTSEDPRWCKVGVPVKL